MDGTVTATAAAVTGATLGGIGTRIGRGGLGKAGDPAEVGTSARLQVRVQVHGDPAATSTEPPEGDRWVFGLGLIRQTCEVGHDTTTPLYFIPLCYDRAIGTAIRMYRIALPALILDTHTSSCLPL